MISIIFYKKYPYLKDPMRFAFWTFLDIYKCPFLSYSRLSFFTALKNRGTLRMLVIAAYSMRILKPDLLENLGFFEKSGFVGPFFGHFSYETSHKNYAATNIIDIFKTFLLNMVRGSKVRNSQCDLFKIS